MQLIKPSIEFEWMTDAPLRVIERAGRTCWKSALKEGGTEEFIRMLLRKGHHAMIEHASASYRVICDRGVTHEFVRHRLFSYAQESTRYCNYKGGVTFIIPEWLYDTFEPGEYRTSLLRKAVYHNNKLIDFPNHPGLHVATSSRLWFESMVYSELFYRGLIEKGWTPQQARSVLPNSLKTEIVITGNLREWLHFFSLRCAAAAHPQMREVAFMILKDIKKRIPVIFDLKDESCMR